MLLSNAIAVERLINESEMKRLALFTLWLLGTTSIALAETIPATDTRITIVGRTHIVGTTVSFDWTATTIRIAYSGKTLSMKVSDTHRNYYNLWIDRPTNEEPNRIIATFGSDSTITLVDANDPVNKTRRGIHEVVLQKRTEGEQGTTTLIEFSADKFYPATPLSERQLEFIGDSYTCGYGSENSVKTDPFTPETENASKTYAAIIARYFGADYFAIAHSGMGIARNYNSKFDGWWMPERYLQTFDMDSTKQYQWNVTNSDFRPAMTIIYLGANDFSVAMQPKYEKFRNQYYKLLREIKANYGDDYPVLCVATKAHEYLFTYMRDLVNNCGMKNVYYLGLCPALHDSDSDLGASSHPNYMGHQKIAYSIIPYVATITGWGLQDEPVK